jgi:hypothetical protein
MRTQEKQKMVLLLEEDNLCVGLGKEQPKSILDLEWSSAMEKLILNRHRLTTEQENTILKLAREL